MKKQFEIRRIFLLMSAAGFMTLSNTAMASAFSLWEQDAASLGNFHAGVAAIADDASTNWYNSAGLLRVKHQEIVAGVDPILTDFRFNGTVDNHNLIGRRGLLGPQSVVAQGGNGSAVPFFHYVAPLSDCMSFGLSVSAPFGLKTDYGNDTFVRYSADLTKLQVINIGPSLAFGNEQFSFGFGVDWQRLNAELSNYVSALTPRFDTYSLNKGSSNAWGYHLGAMYQILPQTRVGLSYRSKVTHNVKGNSRLEGPLANGFQGGTQYSGNFRATASLPPTTMLGIVQALNPCWDLLGHVSYTQWSVFKNLRLRNVAGIDPTTFEPSNSLEVLIPEHYHNTWNVSVGANYHPCEQWILRSGIGYDQSPTSESYRNLQLPDSNRIAIGLGAHYQAIKCLGFDFGWNHLFAKKSHIRHLTQEFGPEEVTTDGSVRAGADVFGFGVRWDLT